MDKSVDQVFGDLREEVVKAKSLSQALTITGVKLRRHCGRSCDSKLPLPGAYSSQPVIYGKAIQA
jgi:hypothetical protein